MKKNLISQDKNELSNEFKNSLEDILREGARKLLQQAIENEVEEHIEQFKNLRDESNHRCVTRNGHLPKRKIQTGLGSIPIQQPRIRDIRKNSKFTSSILPPYARRTPSIEAVIPALYLKGISTNDFPEALKAILGDNAQGLSPTNIVRLKQTWEKEYKDWNKRNLSEKQYVYIWADGIYFNIRLDKDRPCILVIMGALKDGTKELIAIHDGHRESKLSWQEVLQGLKNRGLSEAPCLAIGDGALGFWSALEEEFPSTLHQRCWVHKTANVLDKMVKSVQKHAKSMIHEMYMAPNKEEALKSFDAFIHLYGAKYPGACQCLQKDKERLFTFYDFPAVHWRHIRTTNPIESTFATVRHRTRQTKGCGSRTATLIMVFKLSKEAEESWQRITGYKLLDKVVRGIKFKDGEEVNSQEKAA
uniref:Mutator family transposase n=1 Tax=Candidatus Kentrum sp. LPFa TaxID=2126335 RepID=A0A450X6D7_9GAMM|nr:MAG: Transposase (or an inactivated derivative) [Candidatus Kentron sp. LPFa]